MTLYTIPDGVAPHTNLRKIVTNTILRKSILRIAPTRYGMH